MAGRYGFAVRGCIGPGSLKGSQASERIRTINDLLTPATLASSVSESFQVGGIFRNNTTHQQHLTATAVESPSLLTDSVCPSHNGQSSNYQPASKHPPEEGPDNQDIVLCVCTSSSTLRSRCRHSPSHKHRASLCQRARISAPKRYLGYTARQHYSGWSVL